MPAHGDDCKCWITLRTADHTSEKLMDALVAWLAKGRDEDRCKHGGTTSDDVKKMFGVRLKNR